MQATLLLANSAEATPVGTVSALGIGWTVTSAPTPPAALVVLMQIPWDQTNLNHTLEITLLDADGYAVQLGQTATGERAPLQITGDFEAGRPPGLPHGTPIDQAMAINVLPGLPLVPGQAYQWQLKIDGEDIASRRFLVRPAAVGNRHTTT